MQTPSILVLHFLEQKTENHPVTDKNRNIVRFCSRSTVASVRLSLSHLYVPPSGTPNHYRPLPLHPNKRLNAPVILLLFLRCASTRNTFFVLYLRILTSLTTPFVVIVLEDPILASTEPLRPFRDLTPVILCVYSMHSGRSASSTGIHT